MKKITLLIVLLTFSFSWYGNAQITSYPYSEDFEAGPGGWVATNGTNGTWALGTPTANVINSAASGANAWATNLAGNYNASDNSWVQSPVFDLSSLAAPSIEFRIWWNSEFSWDGMVLQSSINSGTSWQNVGALGDPNNWYNDGTINGNPGGQQVGWSGRGTANGSQGWRIARHALTGLGGQSNVIFRFAFGSDTSIQDNGVAFDLVSVFDVACPEPTALTATGITANTAQLSWTESGSATLYNVEIVAAGTPPTGVATATGVSNPYPASGLSAITAYDFYVQADCGGQLSSWSGPSTFITLCDVFIPDYLATFDTFLQNCWEEADSGNPTTGPGNFGTGAWLADGFANIGFTGANKINLWLAEKRDWLLSPQFNLAGGPFQVELDLAIMQFGSSTTAGTLGSDDQVQLLISADNGTTWTTLLSWNNTSVVPVGGSHYVYDLTAYSGQIVQFGIWASEGTVDDAADNDISVDNFQVRAIPSCPEPSGLTVANVGGTSADVSWNGGSQTAWEYVIQPGGTGVPTGNGILLGATTVNETGLDYSTTYEVYVRTDCGGGEYSIWIGPLTFTTTVQMDFIVDCNVGPVNSVSCYDDDGDINPQIFTFTSSDGTTPLNITFNSGNVENNFDELIVLDSDGTTNLNLATPYGNAGNVAGITYQSSGPTISFYINSDFIINCQGSTAINPIDVTVTCATCINPAATYAVIDDCDNGNQFLIDVNITSIGDATSLTISNNVNANTTAVTATGTYQIGPFPFATPVIVTISNDQDVNCVINSTPIQVLACPPANDNCADATVAEVNAGSTCDLLTPGTVLAATPSGVPAGTCTGNPDDDVWFQFTALNEVQLISLINIAGGNTNLDHAVYSGSCGSLTQLYCSPNTASVTPLLTVGNTYYVRVFSFGNIPTTTTFDLCIQKAPENTICELAANFCGDGGPATGSNIIGFPSIGQIACLFTTPNPSWNIIQVGDPGLIEIQINQVNGSGGGLDVDFVLWGPFDSNTDFCAAGVLDQGCPAPNNCPNNTTNPNFYPFGNIIDCSYSAAPQENLTIDNALAGEIYVLLVTNFSNQAGTITINQTNAGDGGAGSTVAEIQVDLGEDQELCGFPDYTLTANSPFADSYEWYEDGFIIAGETGSTLTVTTTNIYTVIAYDEQCDATATDDVLITFGVEPVANPVEDIITCDDASADGIEDFDLESQTPVVLGSQDPTMFNVTYHLTQAEANSSTGALTSPYTNVSNPQTIWIRIEDANATFCSTTTSFQLIISGPTPTATSVDISLCDDASRDGVEQFDLAAHDTNVLNGQSATDFMVSYYASQADADAGTSPLTSPYSNTSNPQTVWARVESNIAVDCYSIIDFDLIVDDIPVTTFSTDFDYEVCPNATVPIIITATAQNYTAGEVTINWLQDGVSIASENGLTLPVLIEGTYTIEVMFNDTQCMSSTDITVIELEACVFPQGISPGVSPGQNDTFDLSSFRVTKLEIFNRNGTLVYSKTNYRDEWHGQSNNGDELPVGTYFYTVEYDGGKQKTAWVYINK